MQEQPNTIGGAGQAPAPAERYMLVSLDERERLYRARMKRLANETIHKWAVWLSNWRSRLDHLGEIDPAQLRDWMKALDKDAGDLHAEIGREAWRLEGAMRSDFPPVPVPEPEPALPLAPEPACEPEKYNYTGRLFRCVDNGTYCLTPGKIYREIASSAGDKYVRVFGEDGLEGDFFAARFEEVVE